MALALKCFVSWLRNTEPPSVLMAGGFFVSLIHVVRFELPVWESRTPSSEGSSGISTPPDHAKNRRGALFLGDWLRCFSCRQNRGRRWFVCPKNDTSLVFCFRWRGVHLFSSLQPCSFSKSPAEQTAPSTSMIKASAQEIPSLRSANRPRRLTSMNC